MPLSKEDRIAFSKVIVQTADNITSIDLAQQSTIAARDQAYNLDQANKRLTDAKTLLISQYHVEINNISGQARSELTEQDFLDGANRILGNSLFPNNVPNTPPSIAPNPWIAIRPYAGNKAIGRQYDDALAPVSGGELPTLASMLARINNLQTAYLQIELTTGQTCIEGTCSLPQYTTEASCELNGGTWDSMTDSIDTYAIIHSELTTLIAEANTYKANMLAEQANIIEDADAVRQATNVAAIAALAAPIADVNTWLGYSNFNTAHGQTTCAGFFAFNPTGLAPTKLSLTQLNNFKASLLARQSAATARSNQILTYLGGITQNLTTGTFTGTGLYYERWLFVNLRLNLIAGSLTEYLGFNQAVNGQNDLKAAYTEQKDLYLSIVNCSVFSAPSNGTNSIHVKNPQGFVAGDNVFIYSETQPELKRTIESVSGNRIVLGQSVPPKYVQSDYARMYKDLTS